MANKLDDIIVEVKTDLMCKGTAIRPIGVSYAFGKETRNLDENPIMPNTSVKATWDSCLIVPNDFYGAYDERHNNIYVTLKNSKDPKMVVILNPFQFESRTAGNQEIDAWGKKIKIQWSQTVGKSDLDHNGRLVSTQSEITIGKP